MAEIRYGLREGPGKGRESTIVADQYFHRRGGHFVARLADGTASYIASTGSGAIAGWVESPKDAAGYSSWKSSTGDVVFVIYPADDNVFELPANESAASVNASSVGLSAALLSSGSTYDMIQSAKIKPGTAASPLTVVDYDVTKKTVLVKVKPGNSHP